MNDELIARIVNALELGVSAGIPTTLKAHESDALLDALALTQAKLDECRKVLRMVEWQEHPNCVCLWCRGHTLDGGHKPDCPRQRALESEG